MESENKLQELKEKESYFTDSKNSSNSILKTNQANLNLQNAFYNDDHADKEAPPTYLVQESPSIKVTKE